MKYLYAFVSALLLGVVLVDAYTVNYYLSVFKAENNYNNVKLAKLLTAEDAIKFAAVSQAVVARQSEQIVVLTKKLDTAKVVFEGLKKELIRTVDQLEKAGGTIKELTDLNSKSASEVERLAKENLDFQAQLSEAAQKLKTANKQIEELQQKLNPEKPISPPAPKKLDNMEVAPLPDGGPA